MRRKRAGMGLILLSVGVGGALLSLVLFMALLLALGQGGTSDCGQAATQLGTGAAVLDATGGAVVGATEYGGPGDPSSGTVGASGVDLDAEPDSFAELGGTSFQTATAMGGLPYGTPLRISWSHHSVIADKQDIGLGGAPIDGHPRVIDLWWQLAGQLGIPYEDGLWSGTVRVERAPASGSANLLGAPATPANLLGAPATLVDPVESAGVPDPTAGDATPAEPGDVSCPTGLSGGGLSVATAAGPRAQLLSDGQAVAPASAPAAVKAIIAAGNQIVAKPYVYGGGHGLPLSLIAPAYDCSSSVSHLLWGGGLLGADSDMTSGELEDWGLPGPGRWVTLYASADHTFMYVAGLRWDTHNAAGPQDGSTGIGWHPLVREADGFVARHPAGL